MKRSTSARRGAFSLLEILVVLAIAAFMAALLFGGFFGVPRLAAPRATCQANLSQVYRAWPPLLERLRHFPFDLHGRRKNVGRIGSAVGTARRSDGGKRHGRALRGGILLKILFAPATAPPIPKVQTWC